MQNEKDKTLVSLTWVLWSYIWGLSPVEQEPELESQLSNLKLAHRGFGAPCAGDHVEENVQHLCYQLSRLKPPGKRFIWRAVEVERTQHFTMFVFVLHGLYNNGGLWKVVA